MKFATEDKLIVDHLCKVSSISLYDLHVEYLLSPAQLLEAVERLKAADIATPRELFVDRSSNFERQVIAFRHDIYNRENDWKTAAAFREARG